MLRLGLKKLGRFLVSVAEPPPVVNRAASSGSRPRAEAFERRVREGAKLREGQGLLAGSIQLLGMNEIRKSFGDRWTKMADLACQIAERTIEAHLCATDTYQRHDDETFILCFAGAGKDEAEAKTRAIVEEVKSQLASAAPELRLDVGHTVAELEWATVEEPDTSVIEAIASKLKKVREDADSAARAWRRDLLAHASVMFSPVWCPERRAVSAYRGLLGEETGKRALQRLSSVSGAEELKASLADLDALLFGRCVEALHGIVQSGDTAQVIVPVNYNTMNDKTHRENYLRLCRDIPDSYHQFVLFELHGAAPGAPVLRVMELALALKAHGSGVLVEVGPGSARIQDLTGSGILGISVSAQLLGPKRGDTPGRASRLGSLAKAHGLKIFVRGADTLGLLEGAVRAHVDFIDGRAVAPSTSAPRGAYAWVPRTTIAA